MPRRATFPFGLQDFEVPSYGLRGAPLRYPRGRTSESEYDRETRLRQEMQMRLREQKFALPVQEEQMRLQNKMQAEGWELKYSSTVRAQVATWNKALQKLNRDPNISPGEKEAMRQAIMQQMYGVEKTWTPPDPNKPRAPEGHEFGVPFMHDDGATYAYEINAQGQVEMKLKQRYDQSPEHHKMEAQRAWEEERGKLRLELMREEIEIREDGAGTERKRRRENWEVEELLNAAGYSSANAPLSGGAPGAGAGAEYIGWARNMGVRPGKEETDLPPDVAMAQAFLKELKRLKSKGRELDPNIGQAIADAKAILARYDARGNR